MIYLSRKLSKENGLMNKGGILKVVGLVSLLSSAVLADNVLQVEELNGQYIQSNEIVTSNVYEENELFELTRLTIPQENWVPLELEDEIEWNARELLGKKYVWGATGPYNYDCSGFTQKIYGDLGIDLPRVSRDQARKGIKLNYNELKKGDLVFFATKKRKPHLVTHVGIYLGDGNFIHASSGAKKIVIFNFNEHSFYKKRFLWGRRVIQEKKSYIASR